MKKEYNLEYQSIVKNRRGANVSMHILYEGFGDIKIWYYKNLLENLSNS